MCLCELLFFYNVIKYFINNNIKYVKCRFALIFRLSWLTFGNNDICE